MGKESWPSIVGVVRLLALPLSFYSYSPREDCQSQLSEHFRGSLVSLLAMFRVVACVHYFACVDFKLLEGYLFQPLDDHDRMRANYQPSS